VKGAGTGLHFGNASGDNRGANESEVGIVFFGDAQTLVLRARKSILRWLRRHGYLDEREPPPAQDDTPDSLRSCQQLALQYGDLVALPSQSQSSERERRFEPKPSHSKHFRTEDGFDLDARVFIAEGDDIGRERLIRYCARPAIALERLTKVADGRYSYRTKYGRGDRTHRVMTGPELMARIAALVPSPRHPLLRYHGVFAPGHCWRRLVVPQPRRRRAKLVRVTARVPTEPELGERDGAPSRECAHREHRPGAIAPAELGAPSDEHDGHIDVLYAADTAAPDEPAPPALCSPFILTDEHLRRLLDGVLLMTRPTATWAHLLRRSHDIDVLSCPKCHGRLRLMAVLRDEAQVRRVLRHFGKPTDPPPRAKARDPADERRVARRSRRRRTPFVDSTDRSSARTAARLCLSHGKTPRSAPRRRTRANNATLYPAAVQLHEDHRFSKRRLDRLPSLPLDDLGSRHAT